MINEKIDLYEYFGAARGKNAGYLHAFVPEPLEELRPKTRPAMLVIPGGGYFMLSQREGEPVAARYMSRGYAAFLLEYSVQTPFPTPLIEACMAIAYIRKNAKKYRVDPEHVGATGFSAGGHLAAMLGNIDDENEVKTAFAAGVSTRPDAIVLSYPVITMGEYTHDGTRDIIMNGGDKTLLSRLSIEKRVTKRSAPAFVWHTFEDDLVPVENSLLLAAAYRRAGVPFSLHVFEKGWHGLSLCSEETNDQSQAERSLAYVGKWFGLALDFLSERGFRVTQAE